MLDAQTVIKKAMELLEAGYETLNSVADQDDQIAYVVNGLDNALFQVAELIDNDEEE